MKNFLFTTTALLSLGLVSNIALANNLSESDKYLQANDMIPSSFSARLGGYAQWYGGYADNDKKELYNTNEFDILSDVEVHFDFESMLRNGIKMGAHMELHAGTTSEAGTIDNTYIYAEGAFGKVMVGRHDNVNEQIGIYSKDIGALGIQETDFYNLIVNPLLVNAINPYDNIISNNLSASYINSDDNLTKISYFSPNFSGFQAGITYAPSGSTGGDDNNFIRPIQSTSSNLTLDATVLTAVYKGKYKEIGFGLSGSYGFNSVNSPSDIDNINQWNIGGNLLYKGFTLSAGYKDIDQGNGGNGDVWDIGLSYETGPYGMSLSYISGNGDSNIKQDTLLLSTTYALSTGIQTFTTLGFGDYKNSSQVKNDGFAAIGGFMLSF